MPLLLVLTSAVVVQGPPGLPGLKGDPGSQGEKVSEALFLFHFPGSKWAGR